MVAKSRVGKASARGVDVARPARDTPAMTPLAVHHVSINVSDLDASLAFYTSTLGLTPRTDRPDLAVQGSWLDAGGQQLHLIVAPTTPAAGQHFALLVEDLNEVVSELRSLGIEVADPRPVGQSRQSFLSDPDGNLVELHQAAGSPTS